VIEVMIMEVRMHVMFVIHSGGSDRSSVCWTKGVPVVSQGGLTGRQSDSHYFGEWSGDRLVNA
jgi:hypothetical protein